MLRLRESATHILVSGAKDDLDAIDEWFKYQPDGYYYAPSYQRWRVSKGDEGWDGWLHPFQRLTGDVGRILRGHRFDLLAMLEGHELAYNGDKLIPSPFSIDAQDVPTNIIEAPFDLDSHQREGVAHWLNHAIGISRVTVSGGKCLGKGTQVMLHSGETCKVEDIKIGDILMGPDGAPRCVLTLGCGRARLFKVQQANGTAFVCNGDHILALQRYHRTGSFYGPNLKYSIKNELVTVNDFVKLPKSARKEYRTYKSAVNFKAQEVPLDAYFLGLWLGDGSSGATAITTADSEIVDYLRLFAAKWNLIMREEKGTGCSTWHLVRPSGKRIQGAMNPVTSILRRLGLLNSKHTGIPLAYLRNSRSVRLALLAGLIDSDGHKKGGRTGQIEITSSWEKLAKDIQWLARSLGYSASLKPKIAVCQTGARTLVRRVRISGNLSEVPTIIKRKQLGNVSRGGTRSAFSVKSIGAGDYYGFELDGDGLFLLGDFTVTHNTAMFAAAAALIKEKFPEARVLYVTQAERLVRQVTKEMKRFLPHFSVGQYGGGVTTGKLAEDMCVCTIAMLHKHFHKLKGGWFDSFMCLFYDECHHCASPTSKKVVLEIPAYFRFGASDSTKSEDKRKSNEIHGLFGPIVVDVEAAPLIRTGRIARPYLYFVDELGWNDKFRMVEHTPALRSKAFVLIDGVWTPGKYLGPVYELEEDGSIKTKRVKGTKKVVEIDPETLAETEDWEYKEVPVIASGLHRVEINGTEMEVDARWALLERTYDKAIVQFKERNERIVEWVQHFVGKGYPTLVVCTRTVHILILEAMIGQVVGADNVQTLFGEDSPTVRDSTFEWFREVGGRVLITPLVKEGISIRAIRAGVIADHITDFEVANQVIGRFIRKKDGTENFAEIVFFLDRQHPVLRRGSETMLTRLKRYKEYVLSWCNRPSEILLLKPSA